jgi:hypothetical protein
MLFTSCKTDPKNANDSKEADQSESSGMSADSEPEKALTLTEKIAYANGYKNWKDVEELKFTFNVDREGNPHFERSWIWKPKSNEVTMMSAEDTLTYDRNAIESSDSTVYKTNGNFVNDKYWLLAPINILWDEESTTTEHTREAEAPISKKPMQKLTVTYDSEGGYTPGDAYDFYFGNDFMVREWVFRKGNQEEPSMVTTWEDYTDAGGLEIAKMHQNEEGSFKLYFTGIEVVTE